MAAVSINQGMPGPDESALQLPRKRWRLLAMARRQWAEITLPFDCRLLERVVNEAPLLAEELGLASGELFLTDYLSLDLDLVQRVMGWLEREQPSDAVSLQQADQASRAELHAGAAQSLAGSFAPEGRPSSGLNLDIVKVTGHGAPGNSAAYLAARLKKAGRDDLLEQIGPGKPHRSVRSAAIAAGIIRPVPTVRLVDDPIKVAAAIARHLPQDQLRSLVEALSQQLTHPT